jgi:lantibiotic biosynthesis protein
VTNPKSTTIKQIHPASEPAFTAAGFFALRAPLLPLAEFLDWGNLATAASASGKEALAQALIADRAVLRERLKAHIARPEIREAIFVASPDLDEYIDHWLREPESKRGERVEGALVRYFTRMCSRSTPFGLFAATTLGRVSAETSLIVSERQDCRRRTRLDMDYLFALVAALAKDPDLRRELRYRPNNSMYLTAGHVRYVEARLRGKRRSYHLTAVEQTDYLNSTLQGAEAGATFSELATPLIDDVITLEDAEDFISQLIECQLLTPDLTLTVTGQEPIHPVIAGLRDLTSAARTVNILEETRDELAALDATGLGVAPERYRAVAEKLKELPAGVELPRLFQVDLVRPSNIAVLGESVVREIGAGVELLRAFFAGAYENQLVQFRQAFSHRYEQREVPLAEVIDDDLGIGFPVGANAKGHAPLLDGIALGVKGEGSSPWRSRESCLLDKLFRVWTEGGDELVLTDQDIKALKLEQPLPCTNTFGVLCKAAASSPEAIANGDFQIFIELAGGASGAALLGRFCHADPALQREVEQHLRADEAQQPDAIFAEIAHLPEGRIGNILARPLLREYEIPYLGGSGAPPEKQLPLTDLMVSVRDQRVILRSTRLGREIIPRLTSAHAWQHERASVYRFLCALQLQGRSPGVLWDWGALGSAPFLPRVVHGRLVFSLARWLVDQKELKPLAESSAEARFQAVQDWRVARKLPRYVVLADHDNTLPVDLENVLSIDSFLHIVKSRSAIELREMWPAPDQLCATGVEGAFVHELIVPFVRRAEAPCALRVVEKQQGATSAARWFAPGSEWLYSKIYSGVVTADRVLREVIDPLLRRAVETGAAERWFFLRYSDPEPHLRVRFQGQPDRLREEVLPALQAALAPWLEDGRIRSMQLDTYEREIERYGGGLGVLLSERVFHHDSAAVVELMNSLDPSDAGLDQRWKLALCGMDRMLDDFGFDLPAKAELVKSTRAGFLAEFKADERVIEQLGERYRKERKGLEHLLDRTNDASSPLSVGLEVLARRSALLQSIAEELRAAEHSAQLTRPLSDIVLSYLHMHANRMLRSSHRAQELVMYDLLTRFYSAQIARQRQTKQGTGALVAA